MLTNHIFFIHYLGTHGSAHSPFNIVRANNKTWHIGGGFCIFNNFSWAHKSPNNLKLYSVSKNMCSASDNIFKYFTLGSMVKIDPHMHGTHIPTFHKKNKKIQKRGTNPHFVLFVLRLPWPSKITPSGWAIEPFFFFG